MTKADLRALRERIEQLPHGNESQFVGDLALHFIDRPDYPEIGVLIDRAIRKRDIGCAISLFDRLVPPRAPQYLELRLYSEGCGAYWGDDELCQHASTRADRHLALAILDCALSVMEARDE